MSQETMKVLFVDDEENILSSLRRAMIDEPYICYFAISGAEALKIMAKERIQIIISDMKMPNMTGLELMKNIKENYPDTVKIILSGYAQITQVIATVNQVDLYKFLLKPWKNEELYSTLSEAVSYVKFIEERNKEILELQNKTLIYQKLMNIKQVSESNNNENIRNIKIISAKFFKNFNFVFLVQSGEKLTSTVNRFEKLYEIYIESLPTMNSNYKIDMLIDALKNDSRISFKFNININDEKYIGNISLITSLIEEMVGYIFNLIGKRLIQVNLIMIDNGFQLQFSIPLGLIMKTDQNVSAEVKILPRYLDFLKELLKLSNIDLSMSNNESELQIVLASENVI